MAFTAFNSTDMDANSPWTETVTQLIRTNFDDHEARILALSAFGNNSIVDDFLAIHGTAGVATTVWDVAGGANAPIVVSQHTARLLTAGAGTFSGMAAAPGKMQINITEEYVAVMQFRVKKAVGSTNDNFTFGFQDASLAINAANIADQSDMIGFYRDPAAAAWVFRVANGGAATTQAGIGTSTSWGVLRLTVTCSGTAGNRKVDVLSGTTDANLAAISGSPFTTNLPAAVDLRPFFGVAFTAATNPQLDVDYCLAYTVGRPLAA